MRARMGGFAVLVLFLLPLASTPASACSRAPIPDFLHLQWDRTEVLFTNQGPVAGFYHLSNGTFQGILSGNPYHGMAASPDGAWVAVASGDSAPPDYDPRFTANTCDALTGTTEVVAVTSGAQVKLFDWAALRFAAGPRELAVWHSALQHPRVYAWGAWDQPRDLRIDKSDASGSTQQQDGPFLPEQGGLLDMVYSPDGALLALVPAGRPALLLLNASTGKPWNATEPLLLLDDQTSPKRVVWSPDGRHLALLAGGRTRFSEVHVAAVTPRGAHWVAEGRFTESLVDGAWGEPGLVVRFLERTRSTGAGEVSTVLRLFQVPDLTLLREVRFNKTWAEGGLAWSPSGDHLAAGFDELRLFDPELRQLRNATVEPPYYPAFEHLPGPKVERGGILQAVPVHALGAAVVLLSVALVLRRRT